MSLRAIDDPDDLLEWVVEYYDSRGELDSYSTHVGDHLAFASSFHACAARPDRRILLSSPWLLQRLAEWFDPALHQRSCQDWTTLKQPAMVAAAA